MEEKRGVIGTLTVFFISYVLLFFVLMQVTGKINIREFFLSNYSCESFWYQGECCLKEEE